MPFGVPAMSPVDAAMIEARTAAARAICIVASEGRASLPVAIKLVATALANLDRARRAQALAQDAASSRQAHFSALDGPVEPVGRLRPAERRPRGPRRGR